VAIKALRRDPQPYAAELRLAAAVKMYEVGQASQELVAEIAGMLCREFMVSLARI